MVRLNIPERIRAGQDPDLKFYSSDLVKIRFEKSDKKEWKTPEGVKPQIKSAV
jgi:hypothetical protein